MKLKEPNISIINVNYNGKKFLKAFFSSLKKLDYQNFEVIFVDNASSDGSIEFVKRNYPKARVIENKKNLGFALANNQGAKIARGKYLFFLNNDTKIHPEVVSKLVEKMEKNPTIGICGGKILSYDGERYFHTGIGVDIFGYPVLGKKIFYIEGSALMIRKSLFEKLGGFDPLYFMFHEDVDLCWRARLLGYKVVAIPDAIIYHFAGGSAGGGEMNNGKYKSSYLRRYYHERNNVRTILKNYQIKTLLFIFPLYFLLNLLEIFIFLFTFKFKIILLYLKAYIWNLVNFGDTLKERRKIQRIRTISDLELMKNMYFRSGKIIAFLKVGIPEFK